jgi:hypothetical protein
MKHDWRFLAMHRVGCRRCKSEFADFDFLGTLSYDEIAEKEGILPNCNEQVAKMVLEA